MSGRFVVIEGIDGAGTEVQSKKLLEYLTKNGVDAIRIEYPDYDSPIGKMMHDYLHKKFDFSVDTQFLLFSADMVKDIPKIRAWLKEGKTIIADRYFTTTIAYQGLEGFKTENALKFAEIFGLPIPDTVIFLKVTPDTSVERKMKEKSSLDRNEENKPFLGRIGAFYEHLIRENVFGSWHAVDGEKSIESVFEQVKKILKV